MSSLFFSLSLFYFCPYTYAFNPVFFSSVSAEFVVWCVCVLIVKANSDF